MKPKIKSRKTAEASRPVTAADIKRQLDEATQRLDANIDQFCYFLMAGGPGNRSAADITRIAAMDTAADIGAILAAAATATGGTK